jgi:hypothetical protein
MKSFKYQNLSDIQKEISKYSNYHVVMQQVPDTKEAHLLCIYCGIGVKWQEYVEDIPLELIANFCEAHRHNPEPVINAVEIYQNKKYKLHPEYGNLNEDYIYNQTLKPMGIDNKVIDISQPIIPGVIPNQIPSLGSPAPKKYEDYFTLSDIQEMVEKMSGNPTPYMMPQRLPELDSMQLKKVWKWSNFKIDIQVRRHQGYAEVRMVCTECKFTKPLLWDYIKDYNHPVWVEIERVSKEHANCGGTEVKESKGRKFKHE